VRWGGRRLMQGRVPMKHERDVQTMMFESLPPPELPAPPGLEYSDAIAAYTIGPGLRADPAALQKQLPPDWKVTDQWGNGILGKIMNGANAVIGFHDTLLECKKAPSTTDPRGRFVIFGIRAYNERTGDRGNLTFTGFTCDPANVPGKFKDKKLAKS